MSRGESMMSELIKSMHELALDLNNHNEFADQLLMKNNTITEKLIAMKEYNQAVNTLDSCQAPGTRAELVSNLQQESRQVQTLKEEKRLLTHTIDELLQLFNTIMDQHRRILEDFQRSDKMLELLDQLRETPDIPVDSMLPKLASLTQFVINKASDDGQKYNQIIAKLSKENSVLRSLLGLTPLKMPSETADVYVDNTNDNVNGGISDLANEYDTSSNTNE